MTYWYGEFDTFSELLAHFGKIRMSQHDILMANLTPLRHLSLLYTIRSSQSMFKYEANFTPFQRFWHLIFISLH